jgi:hypothetical protein
VKRAIISATKGRESNVEYSVMMTKYALENDEKQQVRDCLASLLWNTYDRTMTIPKYPVFVPIDLSMRDDFHPALNLLRCGISEFTFAGLYLFRKTYGYQVSRLPEGDFVISGSKNGKSFFYLPCCFPSKGIFNELMVSYDYMKNMSARQSTAHRIELESRGYIVMEDRDNFDYLYNRKDLAELAGREYHKKRNLVNGFVSMYSCVQKPLKKENASDALAVLDEWRSVKGIEGDYAAASEALALQDELGLRGALYYIGEEPVGWCLGEPVARARMFAIHFEKACDRFKGIYQFINQSYASSLPGYFKHVNREQDLGDEGLRQAKMTYRPAGFVKKYRVVHPDKADFFPKEPSELAEYGPGTGHDCT